MKWLLYSLITVFLLCSASYAEIGSIWVDGKQVIESEAVETDTDNFDGGLSILDTDVQKALDTLDDTVGAIPTTYYLLDGTNANGYLYLDDNKYLKKIDANTVGLYVQNELVMDWTNELDSGQYLGFGAFTQP